MLLWANNHYGDFESDLIMEDYLETFERGLEQQVRTLCCEPLTWGIFCLGPSFSKPD